jgi:hypothetical protein
MKFLYMRAATCIAIAGFLYTSPLAAQDTALVRRVRVQTDSLRAEAARKQGVRVTVARRLATRIDSLVAAKPPAPAPAPDPGPIVPAPGPIEPTPTPSPVPTDTGAIGHLLGFLTPSTSTAALGGSFAQYESDFARFDEPQWTTCGPQWDCINYYDRAAIYYTRWHRTGDTKYRDRAHQVALHYRENYLRPNGYYGVAHHWSMMDGVALHYLTTGDTLSRWAVGQVADNFAYLVNSSPYISDPNVGDNRIQAYAILALLAARETKAPSVGTAGGHPGGNIWGSVLRSALTKILATRDADGQWRLAKCGANGRATHPFMIGLLHDALIRYHDTFEADVRIPAAIKTSADILWRDDWLPASNAFKYVGVECPAEGSPNPAADLNGLILPAYYWLARVTGDATYRTKADAMLLGAVQSGGAGASAKHFNQLYSRTQDAVSSRQP